MLAKSISQIKLLESQTTWSLTGWNIVFVTRNSEVTSGKPCFSSHQSDGLLNKTPHAINISRNVIQLGLEKSILDENFSPLK